MAILQFSVLLFFFWLAFHSTFHTVYSVVEGCLLFRFRLRCASRSRDEMSLHGSPLIVPSRAQIEHKFKFHFLHQGVEGIQGSLGFPGPFGSRGPKGKEPVLNLYLSFFIYQILKMDCNLNCFLPHSLLPSSVLHCFYLKSDCAVAHPALVPYNPSFHYCSV